VLKKGFATPVQEWCTSIRASGVPLTPLQEASIYALESGANSRLLMEAAASGDFPELLRNTMYKAALKSFIEFGHTWEHVVSEVSDIKDFRLNYRNRLSEAEDLLEVKEFGEYKDSDLLDEDMNFKLAKYGRRFSVSWETLVNDDTGKIRRQSERFGRRAAKHLDKNIWAAVLDNGTIYDSTALFTTAHNNMLGATAATTNALNEQNLVTAYAQMRSMTDLRGEKLDITPRFLVVSPQQEPLAWKLTTGNVMPLLPDNSGITGQNPNAYNTISGGNTTVAAANHPNYFQGRLTPLVCQWVENGEWYLVADPKKHDTMEVGFLNGKKEPEILIQDGLMGTAFTHDKIQYRVRLVYGKIVLDYRTWFLGSAAW